MMGLFPWASHASSGNSIPKATFANHSVGAARPPSLIMETLENSRSPLDSEPRSSPLADPAEEWANGKEPNYFSFVDDAV
jgi:hypothetical protein